MDKKIELKNSDIFYFPKDIVYKKVGNYILVYSIKNANWIVLNSEIEKVLLNRLILKEKIGDIITFLDKKDKGVFKKLIAKLMASKFAGLNEYLHSQKIDTTNSILCYLTNECNLRCPHCYMIAGIKNKNELKLSEWKCLLGDFKKNGGISVTLTGGEPIMNNDFAEIVKYSNGIGLVVKVLSNGTLWTDDLIKSLYLYIDEIQISIDGFDEKSNSKMRGKNNFDKVKKNIITFSNLGVKSSIATSFLIEDLNVNTKEKYKEFVENISNETNNKVEFRLSKKMIKGRNVNYSNEQKNEYYKKILEIEDYVHPNSELKNFIEDRLIQNQFLLDCGFGGITVSSNGNIYFCNRISELTSIGNIRNKNIKYFIEEGLKANKKISVDNVEPCKDCYLRYICGGGCRIEDYNFKGKLENSTGTIINTKCSSENIKLIENKLISSFNYYYKF